MTLTLESRQFLTSPAIQPAVRALKDAVGSPGGVLLSGEPSTGRQVVARAIHWASAHGYDGSLDELIFRCARGVDNSGPPFVVVDCASASDVESVVFGGSPADCPAGFEPDGLDQIGAGSHLQAAMGGTLFLRALHDMPTRVQVRLARVLRDREVWITGTDGTHVRTGVCVRVMAAVDRSPNIDPDEQVAPELLRRVAAHRISLPPLRQRREDIPGLVHMLLADMSASFSVPIKTSSTQATDLLAALPWPGNLEELRNLVRALVVNVPSRRIRLRDVLATVRLDGTAPAFAGGSTLREARERFEREYVAAVLRQHQGRMADAARTLGMQRANLYRKVRQLSVPRRRGRDS